MKNGLHEISLSDTENFKSSPSEEFFNDPDGLLKSTTWWNDAHLTACIEGFIDSKLGGYREINKRTAYFLLKNTFAEESKLFFSADTNPVSCYVAVSPAIYYIPNNLNGIGSYLNKKYSAGYAIFNLLKNNFIRRKSERFSVLLENFKKQLFQLKSDDIVINDLVSRTLSLWQALAPKFKKEDFVGCTQWLIKHRHFDLTLIDQVLSNPVPKEQKYENNYFREQVKTISQQRQLFVNILRELRRLFLENHVNVPLARELEKQLDCKISSPQRKQEVISFLFENLERNRTESEIFKIVNKNYNECHDIFDEVFPLIDTEENSNVKILLPFNKNRNHWCVAEILLQKTKKLNRDSNYKIQIFIHDSFGAVSIEDRIFNQLKTVIEDRFSQKYRKKCHLEIESCISPYIKKRQSDSHSCGPISAEELLKRIQGLSLDMDKPHLYGAIDLRKKLFSLIKTRQYKSPEVTTEEKKEMKTDVTTSTSQNPQEPSPTPKPISLPAAAPTESFDVFKIRKTINAIEEKRAKQLPQLQQENQEAKLKLLQLDEKFIQQTWLEEKQKVKKDIEDNSLELKQVNISYDQVINKIRLLKEGISELAEKKMGQTIHDDLQSRFEQFISGESKERLQNKAHQDAKQQKAVFSAMTIEYQIKNQVEFESQLLKVSAEMQAEQDELKEQLHQFSEQKLALENDLSTREAQLADICMEEAKDITGEETCRLNVVDHEKSIINARNQYFENCNRYDDKINISNNNITQNNSSLDTARAELRRLELNIKSVQINISATRGEIAELEKRRYRTERRLRHEWHGHFGGGNKWIPYDVQVEDNDVVNQINAKLEHIKNQQNNITHTNGQIAAKNSQISQLETDKRSLEAGLNQLRADKTNLEQVSWPAQEKKLDAEFKSLCSKKEDASRILSECRIRKGKKENEIENLRDSIRRKTSEIDNLQAILNEKINTLAVFSSKLAACRQALQKLREKVTTDRPDLSKPVEAKIELNSKVEKDLAREESALLAALESAKKSAVEYERQQIKLQNNIRIANEELKNLNDPKLTEYKTQEKILSYKEKIEKTSQAILDIDLIYHETLHQSFLEQGVLVSGYNSEDPLDSLILCLLQGIFSTYPLYRFDSEANANVPELWHKHIAAIKQKLPGYLEIKGGNPIEASVIEQVVDIVNQEFIDDVTLDVMLLDKPITLQKAGLVNKKVVQVTLWQYKQQFLLIMADGPIPNPHPYTHAHRLVNELLSTQKLLEPVCLHAIMRDTSKNILTCPPEQLANYYREQEQKIEKEVKDFQNFQGYLLNRISDKFENGEKDLKLSAARYCLSKLIALATKLSESQVNELLTACRNHFLALLKVSITDELRRRAEVENNLQKLMDANKNNLIKKMQSLEKEIKRKEEVLVKSLAEIKIKEQALAKRVEESSLLLQHHEKQSKDINIEIKHLQELQLIAEKEVKDLQKNTLVSQEQLGKKISEKTDLQERVNILQEEIKKVNEKIEKEKNNQLTFRKELVSINEEKKFQEDKRKDHEGYKARNELRITHLKNWSQFLQSVHERLLNDEKSFKNRRNILEKLAEARKKTDPLIESYNILIGIESLSSLNSPEIRQCVESLGQPTWVTEVENVTKDVLGDPHIQFDGFTKITVSGNNISWQQVIEIIEIDIKKRLQYYGLNINDSGHLVAENSALLGLIADLPPRLKNLIDRNIELHYQHYTELQDTSRVDQNPHWLEKSTGFDSAIAIINNLKIDFSEILRCYADIIELTVGHHLYLDKDIILPGIHLTLFSKNMIHCKENLKIDTSAKQSIGIKHSHARSGHSYRIGGQPNGREGDNGLNGTAGGCAGHIIIKAEGIIENLASMQCIANGANGVDGQQAGDGDIGRDGVGTADADITDTNGWGRAQFHFAQAKIPGLDEHNQYTRLNEFSGWGGNAGLAGLGGGGGLPGEISITDQKNEMHHSFKEDKDDKTCLASWETRTGKPGRDADSRALGGDPGKPGPTGADRMLIKRSFFRETQDIKGEFDDRIFDDHRPYIQSDNETIWSDAIPLFGFLRSIIFDRQPSITKEGYTGKFRREIRLFRYSANLETKQTEGQYRQSPRRDNLSRGQPGKPNLGRSKTEESRNRNDTAQHTQIFADQFQQLQVLHQTATGIEQNHPIASYVIKHKNRLTELEVESSRLSEVIQECQQKEREKAEQSEELTNQLQTVNATIQQLDNQSAKLNQSLQQVHNNLDANNLAQLDTLDQLTQQGSALIQARAALDCTKIDVIAEGSMQMRFNHLFAAIKNALAQNAVALSQEIDTAKAEHLYQSKELATLQKEYAELVKSYQEIEQNHRAKEQHLQILAQQLGHTLQKAESKQETETTSLLKDYNTISLSNTSSPALVVEKNPSRMDPNLNPSQIKIATVEIQLKKIRSIFCKMFSKSMTTYYELEKFEVKIANSERLCITAMQGLRRELTSILTEKWMMEHMGDWKELLKYCSDIIKFSTCTSQGLEEIYLQLQKISEHIEKCRVNKKVTAQCLLALKTISETIDSQYIQLISRVFLTHKEAKNEPKEFIDSLQQALKNGAIARISQTDPLAVANQIAHKLNYFYNFLLISENKLEQKNSKPKNFLLLATNTALAQADELNVEDNFTNEKLIIFNALKFPISEEKRNCDLILAKGPFDVNKLQGSASFAYVISDGAIYFVNKKIKKSDKLTKMTKPDLDGLKQKFKIRQYELQLHSGRTQCVVVSSLLPVQLEAISLATKHTHKLKIGSGFYFEQLQMELEYRYVDMLDQINLKKMSPLVEAYFNAYVSQLKKIIQHKGTSPRFQILQQQALSHFMSLRVSDYICHFPDIPTAQCQALINLYEEVSGLELNEKSKVNKQQLAKQCLEKFINQIGLSAKDWFAVLTDRANEKLLKRHIILCELIYQNIVGKADREQILKSLIICAELDPKLADVLLQTTLMTFKGMINNVEKRLVDKLIKNSNQRQIIEKIQICLAQLGQLWFSPFCLLSADLRFEAWSLITEVNDEKAMVDRLSTMHEQHHATQLELLNSKASMLTTLDLAIGDEKIFQIPKYFQHWLFTINLLIEQCPNLIQEKIINLEDKIKRLKVVMLNSTDSPLLMMLLAVENTLNQYFHARIANHFTQSRLRVKMVIQEIKKTQDDIIQYVSDCLEIKEGIYRGHREKFIQVLLKKIELISHNLKIPPADIVEIFKQLEKKIIGTKATGEIEARIVEAVNEIGWQNIKYKNLFAKCEEELKLAKNLLIANSEQVFQQWYDLSGRVIKFINDPKGVGAIESLALGGIKNFIEDSHVFFENFISQNADQQAKLSERQLSFTLLLEKLFSPSTRETLLSLNKLIDHLRYATYQLSDYLYSEQWLRNISQHEVPEVDEIKKEFELSIRNKFDNVLDEISHYPGSELTKTGFTEGLLEAKTDNFSVWEEQFSLMRKKLHSLEIKGSDELTQTEIATDIYKFIKKNSLSDNVIRLLYLKIKELKNDEILPEVKSITKLLIDYLFKNNLKNSGVVTIYLNKISLLLSVLYRDKWLSDQSKNETALLISASLDQINQINQRPDILLVSYFNLYYGSIDDKTALAILAQVSAGYDLALMSLNNKSRRLIDKEQKYTIKKTAVIQKKPADLFALQFAHSITNKQYHPLLPCFMAILPLISTKIFSKTDCWNLIVQLARDEVTENRHIGLSLDTQNRVKLLQVLISFYIRTNVIPLFKSKPHEKLRLLRLINYIDRWSLKAAQDENDSFKELGSILTIINLLALKQTFKQLLNPSNISRTSRSLVAPKLQPEQLMTSVEAALAARIPALEVRSILIEFSPELWLEKFKQAYFEQIYPLFVQKLTSTSEFENLFSQVYTLAQNKDYTVIWLQSIDAILKVRATQQISLENINDLLECIIALGDIPKIYKSIISQPVLLVIKESLFERAQLTIEKCIIENPQKEILRNQLESMKLNIINSDNLGNCFLRIFSRSLSQYQKDQNELIHPGLIQETLNFINETEAFRDKAVLLKLAKQSIMTWKILLKRKKITQALGIENIVQGGKLIDCFIRIEKDKNTQLLDKLMLIIKQKGAMIIPDLLIRVAERFASQQWVLEEDSLQILNTNSPLIWLEELDSLYNKKRSQKIVERSAQKLLDCMREDKDSVNKTIQHLMVVKDGFSILEHRLQAIDKQFVIVQDWKEDKIQQWAKDFKENGVVNFSIETRVNEFIAVMMRAVAISKNNDKFLPRDTQRIAFLIFIDAIQKNIGRLANISTGEGKSLITVMLAIARALRGEKVDIITSSRILAERDTEASRKLFNLFNITVSNNCDDACEKNELERKKRYLECDVIYGETGCFQRDLLLTDFFGKEIRGKVGASTPGNSLIIDEVDSMFIDNAEKILYISHSISELQNLKDLFLLIWSAVNSPDNYHYSEESIENVKKFIENCIKDQNLSIPKALYDFVQRRLPVWIKSAYHAKSIHSGEQYVNNKKTGKVFIMDLDTGVEQLSTQWSNGLHQFIQLKHNQKLTEESLKAVFMANATFFKKYNGNINGMTGTLGSNHEMELLAGLYKIDFFRLPRFCEERYIQDDDIVVGSEEEWLNQIVADVHAKRNTNGKLNEAVQIQATEDVDTGNLELKKFELEKTDIAIKLNKNIEDEKAVNTRVEELKILLARDIAPADIAEKSGIIEHRQKTLSEYKQLNDQLQSIKIIIKDLNREKLDNEQRIMLKKSDIRSNEDLRDNKPGRAILIICENQNKVLAIQTKLKDKFGSKWIRTYDSALEEFSMDRLGPEDIIIATNIAGRGTDFETSEALERNGGLHVILSYVPSNLRIEIQAFRRTSRQGHKGSGKFIVYDARANDQQITVEYLREMRDKRESERLDKIQSHGIPKIERENELFQKFVTLQKDITLELESAKKDPSELDLKIIELQLKSLRNMWAFFLDKISDKVGDILQFSAADLAKEFENFVVDVRQLLQSAQFQLITEPSELIKLAKLYQSDKIQKNEDDRTCFRLAEDCYNAIIVKDPEFSGFAYYYKAQCIIGQASDYGSKVRARTALKRAIELLENRISRISTANQIIHFVGQVKLSHGFGLDPDLFTQSNVNEISLIQIHLQAAREALGTELSLDILKSGTVTGDEDKIIFDNLRDKFKDYIKNYRLSKKVDIKPTDEKYSPEEIFRNGIRIEFPNDFLFCKSLVIDIIKKSRDSSRELLPNAFSELMLTKNKFIAEMKDHLEKKSVMTLDENATVNGKGQWDVPIMKQCDSEIRHRIKHYILESKQSKPECEWEVEIKTLTQWRDESVRELIEYLKQQKITKVAEVFMLTTASQAIVKNYLEKLCVLRKTADPDFSDLGLENFPKFFSGKENLIKQALVTACEKNVEITQDYLKLSDKAFNLLFCLLKANGFLKTTLLEALQFKGSFSSYHYFAVENEIISIYTQSITGKSTDISFPVDASEKSKILWMRLQEQKVIKAPTIKFPLLPTGNPQDLLDKIKDNVNREIKTLLNGIGERNEKDLEKYGESIYKSLERLVGTIKQFEKIKVKPKDLQSYFTNSPMPPEVVDFTLQARDIVLSLVEDRGWWDWGAFTVFIMGITQIVIGVLVGVCSFGTASYLSAVLISEGVGDMIFAVQSTLQQNFSWSAYGNYKWQSLLISVATAGIGAYVSKGAQVAKLGIDTVKASVFNMLAKQLLTKCIEVGITCLTTVAVEKLIKETCNALLRELQGNFETWVRDTSSFQIAQAKLKVLLEKLFDKFGALEADTIVREMMVDNQRIRQESLSNQVNSKVVEVMQKLSGHLSSAADQLSKSGNGTIKAIGEIAKITSKIAQAADIVNKFKEIASMTPESLRLFEESLTRAHSKEPKYEQVGSSQSQDKAGWCTNQLDKQVKIIIEEIKRFLMRAVSQPGSQYILQFATRSMTSFLTERLAGDLQEFKNQGLAIVDLTEVTNDEDKSNPSAEESSSTIQLNEAPPSAPQKSASRGPASMSTHSLDEKKPKHKHYNKARLFVEKTAPTTTVQPSSNHAKKSLTFAEQGMALASIGVNAIELTRGVNTQTALANSVYNIDQLATNIYSYFSESSQDSLVTTGISDIFPKWSSERILSCAQMVGGGLGITAGITSVVGAGAAIYSLDQFMTGVDGCIFNKPRESHFASGLKSFFPNHYKEIDFTIGAGLTVGPQLYSSAKGMLSEAGIFSNGTQRLQITSQDFRLTPAELSAKVKYNIGESQIARGSGNFSLFPIHEPKQQLALNYYLYEAKESYRGALAHMKGINFELDVNLRSIPKGRTLAQYNILGRQGRYFTEPGTPVSQLGVYTSGFSSQPTLFRATKPTMVLESTARDMVDTYSLKDYNLQIVTKGGGKQFFSPDRSAWSPVPK
jgi:Holliday junction resolvase-like predicted endonuclease